MAEQTPPVNGTVAYLRHIGAAPDTYDDLIGRLATQPEGTRPGRVVRAERSGAEVATAAGLIRATWEEPVCTGDWVLVLPSPTDTDAGAAIPQTPRTSARITYCQPRRSAFVRRSADTDRPQVLAANIDETWIVVPGDLPLSAPRMERTLVLAWESGADPVVILTKADVAPPAAIRAAREVMGAVGPSIPVLAVSSVAGDGLAELAGRVGPERTAALLGSSGAGKSSLVNALAGADVAAVGAVRQSDSKGRHTTSWRELVVLPGGGALIDTPGLRSVGLWVDEGGLAATFADIVDLAASCRFSDCSHGGEPGCAVQEAIAGGSLARRRLDSYAKLGQEAAEAEQRHLHRLEAQQRREATARTRKIRYQDRQR